MADTRATDCAVAARHFISQIDAAPVQRRPFPHLPVAPVFPEDFYARVRERLPPLSKYDRAVSQYADKSQREVNRFDLWLNDANLARLDRTRAAFWREFRRHFTSDAVTDALLAKLFGKRPPKGVTPPPRERVTLVCRLVRERGPFSLRPHVDREVHPITMVLYLPDDNRRRSMGTTLYRMEGASHIVEDRRLPYRKNAGLAMLRTPDAWHGGDWSRAPADFVRNTVHLYVCRT